MHPIFRHTYDGIVPWLQGILTADCIHCHDAVAETPLQLCSECAQEIPHTLKTVSLDSAIVHEFWSLGCYRGPLGSVIRKGKYAARQHLFETLGEYLAGALLRLTTCRCRGVSSFTLATIVATWLQSIQGAWFEVSRILKVPHFQLLRRIDPKEQASRLLIERSIHLTGRFGLHPRVDAVGVPDSVLLVDDVVTSGATFEGCAIELLNIGVSRVFGVAVANSR